MRPFIRSFLPSSILEDESVDSQRILSFVGMTLGYIVFLLPLLAFFLGVGQRRLSWALGVAILLLSLTLLLYRTTGLFVASVNGVLFLFWGLSLYSSFYLGGLHAPLLYGVLLLPVLGVFLLGRWGSVAWGGIAAMSFVVLAIYDAPASASLALPAAQMKGLQVGSMLGLVGFLSFLAWGFDSARENFKSEVHTSHQALRHSQEQMRSVMSYSPIMLWSLAADGTILLAEGSKRVHFSPDDATLVGAHYGELYKDSMLCELMETALSGDDCSASIERGDQTFEAHFSPVYEGEKLVGAVGIATDITSNQRFERIQKLNDELRVARDEALEANKIKSLFLANMSHELRTPLNAIIGYSEMLEEEAEDLEIEDFAIDLKKIHEAGRHLLALINDILDLSKVESGKVDTLFEDLPLNDFVREVVDETRGLAQKNGNTVEIIVPDSTVIVQTDRRRLRQILFNLLSNASKFTENGRVTVELTRGEKDGLPGALFHIRDTGIGMSADQIDSAFAPFSQVDGSLTRKYGGTGLGLTICRRFCELLGGDLGVKSEIDVGSTFTVWLPKSRDNKSARHRAVFEGVDKPGVLHHYREDAPTILVIDDDESVRGLLVRMLSKEGYNVVTASGGEEGIRLAKQYEPAAITLDVMMPGVSGWDVLSMLKADEALAKIPVVMLTIVDEVSKGYALGASEYLTKPFERHHLLAVLQEYKSCKEKGPVLVVEDDDNTRELLQRTFTQHGWSVMTAENGLVALDKMDEEEPALILLDLMMPEMDGFTFMEVVRQNERWESTPIIVLTAMELTSEDHERLRGGILEIFQKGSYSFEELERQIHRQLQRSLLGKQVREAIES